MNYQQPSAHDLGELIEHAAELDFDTVFIQPQFDRTAAKTLAEQIDGEVVTLDPLAEDWFASMRAAADGIAAASR